MGVLSPMASALRSALRMYRAHVQTCIRTNAQNMLDMPRALHPRLRTRQNILAELGGVELEDIDSW